MSAEPFDPGQCDVAGCTAPAIWADIGECGDVWLCGEHAVNRGLDARPEPTDGAQPQ